MREFTIEYEKGGKLGCFLLDESAPKICDLFWDSLPMDTIGFHTRWSGRQNAIVPRWNALPPMENQTLFLGKGDIGYFREWEGLYQQTGLQVIVLGYGPEYLQDERGESLVSVFARVRTDCLETLVSMGLRVWQSGEEKVQIVKA